MSYNCGSDKNSYKDFKESDIWVDAPISSENTWRTPQKISTPKKESTQRTSTPVPDILQNINETCDVLGTRNAYMAWKDHLHAPPTKMKIRGASFTNDEFISGHIVMKEEEKREYNKENNNYMPLNKCFVNLLINGPQPLVCRVHGDANHMNHLSKCFCLPSCSCERDLAQNTNLPIGYRYNVVPMMSNVNDPVGYRDPMCIYTN